MLIPEDFVSAAGPSYKRQVRWHVELRFHNAPVVDRLRDLNKDEMHQVMKGAAIEDVDTGRSYATLLEATSFLGKTCLQRNILASIIILSPSRV